MIKLDTIQVSKMTFNDGAVEYTARLELNARHHIPAIVLQDIRDTPELETHVQEELQQRIWHMVYGDLRDEIFKLVHEIKFHADPSQSCVELDRAIGKVEGMLK